MYYIYKYINRCIHTYAYTYTYTSTYTYTYTHIYILTQNMNELEKFKQYIYNRTR